MTVHREIDVDTIFYTGRNSLAEGCVLQIRPAGGGPWQTCATTRNGQLVTVSRAHFSNVPGRRTSHLEVDPDHRESRRGPTLADDTLATLRHLSERWLAPTTEPDARPDSRIENWDKIHYRGRHGNPPEGAVPEITASTVPYLSSQVRAGHQYEIRMDWGLPYCLYKRGDTSNRIVPFGFGDSQVDGERIPYQASWNQTRRVRFTIPGNFDRERNYTTEVWNPSTQRFQPLPMPTGVRWPASIAELNREQLERRKQSRTDGWMFRGEEHNFRPRPRLMLPHTDGFLLLLKLWQATLGAYSLLCGYRSVLGYVERDRQTIGQLEQIFEMAGRAGDPDAATTRMARNALQLLQHFRRQADTKVNQIDQRYEGQQQLFNYLLNWWGNATGEYNPSFRTRWEGHWHHFTDFLGPITFMEMAVWVMRRSPLADQFFQRYGRRMIQIPSAAGANFESLSGDSNPMLPVRRLRGTASFDANASMSWTIRSLKTFTAVNGMFMYHHFRAIYPRAQALNALADFQPPAGMRISDFGAFVEFITGMDQTQTREFVDDMVGSTPSSTPPDRSQLARPIRRMQDIDGMSTRIGMVADVIDIIQRTCKILKLSDSLSNRDWTTNDRIAMWNECFQIGGSSTSLIASIVGGQVGRQLGRFALPFAAADACVEQYTFVQEGRNFLAGTQTPARVGVQYMKVIGAQLALTATAVGIAGGPVGWVALVAVAFGSSAALLQNYLDGRRPAVRNYGDGLRTQLFRVTGVRGLTPFDPVPGRGSRGNVEPFRNLVQSYNRQKQLWADRPEGGLRLEDLFGREGDVLWAVFDRHLMARWKFLMMNDTQAAGDFVQYCQQSSHLDRRVIGGTWPPSGTYTSDTNRPPSMGTSVSRIPHPMPPPPPWLHIHPLGRAPVSPPGGGGMAPLRGR